jgi:hypothetical protein
MLLAGSLMALLGLYVAARFSERQFTQARSQPWRTATMILLRGAALARRDDEIVLVFAATFLVNGAAVVFGRLYPKQVVELGLPERLDPMMWFTALGLLTFIAGALALRLVEAHIHRIAVARRAYAAACGAGALGVLLLATAPDPFTGSAAVLLVAGVTQPVTRAVGAIWVNARATNDVRATMQSLRAQMQYAGELICGLTLAFLAQALSITWAFTGACVLAAGAGLIVAYRQVFIDE